MKKIFFALTGLAVMAAGCKLETGYEISPANNLVPLTIQAELPETRTHIEKAENGWQPYWNEKDSIFVTLSTDFSKAFTFTNTTGAGIKASFSGAIEVGEPGEITTWAYYPKKGGRAESIFKFDISPEQTVPGLDTFDPYCDLLVSNAAKVTMVDGKITGSEPYVFKRMMAVVQVKVLDATTGSQLSGKKIKAVRLTSSSQTLSGRARVNIVKGEFDEKRFDNDYIYNYVGAKYEGDDWTAGSGKGAFIILNPCTLPANSTLSLAVTLDDESTFTHTATVPNDITLATNTLPTFNFTFNDEDLNPSAEPVTWDFSTDEWQAALAAQASEACAETNGNKNVDSWSVSLNGLSYTSGGKNGKWSTSGYIQPNGGGSTTTRVFTFIAPSDGKLTVTASTPTKDAVRNVCVTKADNQSVPVDGSKGNLVFNVKEGTVNVYPDAGIRFYKFVYVPGESGGDDPQNDDPDQPAEAEGELECTDPPTVGNVPVDQIYGFAEGVTGGAGGAVLHFNNGKALQTWLLARTKSEKKGDHSPVTIWLSGTFGPEDGRDFSEAHPWFDVKDVSNLSFFGTDDFVMDRIGIFCVRADNIIIRNINFQQPKANNGADAVSMQECDGVWVDHCTFTSLNQVKDYEDGSTDITHGSKNVTVSWCRYIKTQKSCLVGHSNSQSGDAAITATFHHNWFDGSSSRHPRVRFGTAHVYNNLFDGCTTYGVGSAYGAKVLVEYNYFDAVQLPTDICTYPAKESNESNLQGSVAGYLYPTGNVYVNRPAKAKDPYPLSNVKYKAYNGETLGTPLTYADFKPAYSYTVTAAADVPSVVKEGAGYGKLGWTAAPVGVDNGGISEYNGSEEDPVNPDPGNGEEDPEQPGDSSAHTYILYVNDSKAVVKTADGVSGSNYFTNSESLADFSKDYNGPTFTVNNTAYKYGLKFDSKGSVSFTTSATFNSTVRFFFVRRKSGDTGAKMQLVPAEGEAQVFETPYDAPADSGEIALQKGMTYTVKQKSNEQALIYIIVKESE